MSDAPGDAMIAADNLTKIYGTFPAVQDISFTCRRGEIVGFLGPNGAGKTTTMRILTGYLPPTSGRAAIAGHDTLSDSLAARRRLGYLPETVPLYPEMSIRAYLTFVGRLRRVPELGARIDEVLDELDLLPRADSYIGTLSKGMRQRVGLAQAMLHDPDVLILDEPTLGLDPRQVVEIRQLIMRLGRQHTILLSTHILSEVEQICDRVLMIFDGRLRADLPLADLVGSVGGQQMTLRLAAPQADTAPTLERLAGVGAVSPQGGGLFSVRFDGGDETRTAVAGTAVNAGWGLLELSVETPSLESIFLERLREAQAARPAVPDALSVEALPEEEE